MADKINTGGPAFARTAFYGPEANYHRDHAGHEGMQLRDYFAGQVIAGWGEGYRFIAWSVRERTPDASAMAIAAYEIADAMIAARERR